MLNKGKKQKLLSALKLYNKKFLNDKLVELDESGTRLMVNSFLTDVLGYIPIEEVKTEYMIRGTYADYVIQTKGVQHFLIEVKSLSLQLSDKHLRQAINYGANEGIEWVLLTNGKQFDFYRIIFGKPIESRKIFSIDLSEKDNLKESADYIEFIHRESVLNKGLKLLWNKTVALDPEYISGLLYDSTIVNFIKRHLKKKFRAKFTDSEVCNSLDRIIAEAVTLDKVKVFRTRKCKKQVVKDESIDRGSNSSVSVS